jgi:copper chaperone CopZ
MRRTKLSDATPYEPGHVVAERLAADMTGPRTHGPLRSVKVHIPGAGCPSCFNEVIEHVLQIDGVHEAHCSITNDCLEVTGPGFAVASLLDTLRRYLHDAKNSSHGCQTLPVDLHFVMPFEEQATPERVAPGAGRTILPMETLTEAMRRLRANGYVHDLRAAEGGNLSCGTCESLSDPENVAIAETVRFEGDSNPDDEAILLALSCPGGCLGQFSAAFGPTAAALDTKVLQRLAGDHV